MMKKLRQLLKEFALLVSVMSRIPVRVPWDMDDTALGRSLRFLPLLGLLMSVFSVVVAYYVSFSGDPLAAACVLGMMIVFTGGLNLTGLMNVSEGLYKGRSREESLGIIKAGKAGNRGMVVCCATLVLKYAAYLTLLNNLWIGDFAVIFIAAVVFSRFAVLFTVKVFPAARTFGMGAAFHNNFSRGGFFFSLAVTVIIFLLLNDFRIWVYGLFALFFVGCIGNLWKNRLGGLTNSCYGAIAEWAELFFLLGYFIFSAL